MIIIGEKINGSIPSVKEAIEKRDAAFIADRAVKQAAAGADFIDVCASTAPELEIETLLTANKNELNIMTVMPLLIMLTLNGAGNMSIVQNTPENIVVKLAALGLFAAAYLWGKKIIEIKV